MEQSLEFIDLLGRLSSDPDVESTFQRLLIQRRPACRREDEEDPETLKTQDWILNWRKGIEFGFEDPACFLGDHPDEVGKGPMMLTEVYFYGDHPDVKPFTGRLPYQLQLSDDRASVRGKLGRWESTRRSYTRDTWELPDYRMTVSYTEDGARIGFVLCAVRPPLMPADKDDAAMLPDVERMLQVMGKRLDDPDLSLVLAPLRLDQTLMDDGDGLAANFKSLFGLEIYFGYVGGGSQFVLSNVVLFPDHTLDAAGWPRSLPLGLSFNDSPEQMLQKVGTPPESVTEMDFIGTAAWQFSEYSLAVEFSTMENHILSLQIMAPGALRRS